MLQRLLRFQIRDWALPIAICVTLVALHAMGDQTVQTLRYERGAVLAGETWRLVTAHLVHADLAHLAWNVLGVVLVWWLFTDEYSAVDWLLIMVGSTVAIDLGFLFAMPKLDWYVGFSGVLHGLMAAGLLSWLLRVRDPLTTIVTALFVAKLAWEHLVGPLPFTARSMTLPVIHEAHSFGAIGGAATAAALQAIRRRRAASL